MAITMYGIKNCDTIKKARVWLEANEIAYAFHDYKAQGIDEANLRRWVAEHGWEVILNRAGTTFRALPDDAKQHLDADKAVALMIANPSMIKRPVLDIGERRIVGFKPDIYAAAFS
ncbi:MAG: ArsC family reductase [Sphingobium sp.]